MSKKRYYLRKAKGVDESSADCLDSRAVIDRVWDKVICRCYFKSDAKNIVKAMNASHQDRYTDDVEIAVKLGI